MFLSGGNRKVTRIKRLKHAHYIRNVCASDYQVVV